jgi:hypothetical protein
LAESGLSAKNRREKCERKILRTAGAGAMTECFSGHEVPTRWVLFPFQEFRVSHDAATPSCGLVDFSFCMNASELFAAASPEKGVEILDFFAASDRNAYRAAITLLASRRNLRPLFLEKKPKGERHQWMAEALGRKRNEDLALELLQNWVLQARTEMVVQFLGDLGIAHDGEGLIDQTPNEPAPELVDQAVERLLSGFPAEDVGIYLHLFVTMDPAGWNHLRQLLEIRPELRLPRAEAMSVAAAS